MITNNDSALIVGLRTQTWDRYLSEDGRGEVVGVGVVRYVKDSRGSLRLEDLRFTLTQGKSRETWSRYDTRSVFLRLPRIGLRKCVLVNRESIVLNTSSRVFKGVLLQIVVNRCKYSIYLQVNK